MWAHGKTAKRGLELLAEREHLELVPNGDSATYNFTLGELETLLREHGPVFFG